MKCGRAGLRPRPWRARRLVLSFVALMAGCSGGAALAAPPSTITFSIPAGPLSAGLVKFAVQANISLGLGAIDGCAGAGHGLTGPHTVEDGLQIMLKGSGCSYRRLDAHAYEIRPAPRTTPS